jgi:hypothetical protein
MSMVCPQCNKIYEKQERVCPTCSVQLMFYARIGGNSASAVPAAEDNSNLWQQTGWGRIIVGLILAQGLALGLKQLLSAGFMASGEDGSAELWGTLTGLALLHSLHAVGLFVGGALAGAGQSRGLLYGSLVGLANGMIFLHLQPQSAQLLPDNMHYAQPLVHLLLGALGGAIGQAIWRPTPRLPMPAARQGSTPAPQLLEMRWLHGPIAWGRVTAGSIVVACGVVWSSLVMKWMIDASQGALTLTTHFQAKLVSWEIAGMAMFAGACMAGATCRNGTKQGLGVGIGGAALYLGFEMANPKNQLETLVFTVICMVAVGLFGGWFGGQLFPPLGRASRGRRIIDL